jgi:hypothetical protein
MRGLAAAAIVAVAVAGCGGSDPKQATEAEPPQRPAPKLELDKRLPAVEVKVIRGWITARNKHDYPGAASFFAPGAIVDQGTPLSLPTRKAAIIWNAGLPCDADLTAIRQVRAKPLATFALREGPGGPCDGDATVRFTIKGGKITKWEQLPEQVPQGSAA